MAKRVKIVSPALALTGPEGVEFRKTHGTTVRQASYTDNIHIMLAACLVPLIVALAMLVTAQAVGSMPGAVRTALRVAAMLIFAAEFLIAFIEGVRYDKNLRDFYLSAIARGGEAVDVRSKKAIGYYRDWGWMVYVGNGAAFAVFILFLVLSFIPNTDTNIVSGLLPFYSVSMISNIRSIKLLYAMVIFLDLDEGMIIGQTLYPYTVLGDLRETDVDRYELWYGGKAVMRGTLPKEVVSLWRETVAIVEKYGSYLNGGAAIDS